MLINDHEFTALFAATRKNHHAICIELHKIAQLAATRITFRTEDDRDDAVQSAVVRAVEAIGKFDRERFDSAYQYFFTVIKRALLGEELAIYLERRRTVSIHSLKGALFA